MPDVERTYAVTGLVIDTLRTGAYIIALYHAVHAVCQQQIIFGKHCYLN